MGSSVAAVAVGSLTVERLSHRSAVLAAAALPPIVALANGGAHWLTGRSSPLVPDAQQYLEFAHTGAAFGTYREPAWIVLLMAVQAVLGPTRDASRLLGVLGFVFLVTAFLLAARRLYGPLAGTLLAVLLAVDPWLGLHASLGLREETAAGGVLLVALAACDRTWFRRWAPLAAAGTGALALLRWDTLLLTVPVLVAAGIVTPVSPRKAAMGACALAAFVVPHLVANWLFIGDPMAHTNEHATFFAYLEFGWVRRLDSPILGWGTYVFGMHGPVEIARRMVEGTVVAPVRVVHAALGGSVWLSAAVVAFAGLGGLLLLRSRASWPFGLLMILASGEFAFIARLMDERLGLTIAPLALLSLAAVAREVAPALWRSRKAQTAWGSTTG